MSARRLGWLIARARHAYYVAVLPIYGVGVALVVGVVLDLYQAMVAIVISPDKRGRWDLYHMLPNWPWGDGTRFSWPLSLCC